MQQILRSIEPSAVVDNDALLFMLGEELKRPLTTIKALAEQTDNRSIQLEARKALRSVDNMLYFQQIATNQQQLKFTTVHVGNTLTQVAYDMRPLTIEKGCTTHIQIQPGMTPVHADPVALRTGIESLWQAMIGMTSKPSSVNWQIYKSRHGIRLSVFNDSIDLTSVQLSKKNAGGKVRQPFQGIAGPATDLITAQGLFDLIGSKVTKVYKDGQHGLAITLKQSTQLALV